MPYRWLLLFLALSRKVKAQGFGLSLMEVPESRKQQIECTVALIRKYFLSGESLSGSILHLSITSAPIYDQQSILYALHADSIYNWTIVLENPETAGEMETNIEHVLHEQPQCYFFVIQSIEPLEIEKIFENWRAKLNWNALAQFIVYLSKIWDSEMEMNAIMIDILLAFTNRNIFNVNVIGRSTTNKLYYAKTVFPYHPDNICGNRVTSMETLDVCIQLEDAVEEDDESHEVETYEIDESELTYDKEENSSLTTISYDNDNISAAQNTNNIESADIYADNSTQSDEHKTIVREISSGLFLEKFPNNLNLCPLRAGIRPLEPFIFTEAIDISPSITKTDTEEYNETLEYDENYSSMYDSYSGADEHANTENRFNGIEYKMIQTISERLNISIQIEVENVNLFLLFQKLIDRDIEMIVGGIDENPSTSQYMSSSIRYHQDELTWCVAKSRHTSNLFNFLATFQLGPWLLTILFILTASLGISLCQKLLKLRLPSLESYFSINLHVMSITLTQALNLKPIPLPTSLKLCFVTTFLMGFMFGNIYQSFLISTLTTAKTAHQISHLIEIYEHRMHILGSSEYIRHLKKEGEIYHYIQKQYEICEQIEECLQDAVENTNLAVVVSRQHFLGNPRIPHDNLYCFGRNDNIYFYFVSILMPKKFYLLHKINPIIQNMIESGHIQKWTLDLNIYRKYTKQIQDVREVQAKSLSLSEIAGTFVFSGLLLAFASSTFFTECAVHWLVVGVGTRLKLAKYLHKKFS